MDQELAQMYNTPGRHTPEDHTKLAEAELFAKLAAENNIDLNDLTDDQIQQLWESTFSKAAEETCPKCEKSKSECKCDSAEDKVAAAAQAEFAQKQEWKQKVAECDKLGRIMAHAYINELTAIDQAAKTAGAKKVAEMPPQFAAAAGGGAPPEKKEEGDKDEDKKEEKKDDEESKSEEKGASAIDQLAAKHALDLAKQAGMNTKVAAKRVDAVLTLGLATESTKTASAKTLEETIHVRALELLEKAGYQVDWTR